MNARPLLTIWGGEPGSLPAPFPVSAATRGPVAAPREAARRTGSLASLIAGPNDLPAQRWGVVAPRGALGDELLALVKPLCDHRAAEQGDDVLVYRPEAHATAADAEEFLELDHRKQAARLAEARGGGGGDAWAALPRYLLLLGDADRISWEFQQTLSRHGLFVGRLCFPSAAGYTAYVEKVLRAEGAGVPSRAALFYGVHDGTSATTSATAGLLGPMAAELGHALRTGRHRAGPLSIATLGLDGAPPEEAFRAMLERAAAATGGAMFSVSHGVGLDAGVSPEVRRARQGGLQLAGDRALFADGVHERRPSGAADPALEPVAAFADGVATRPFLELGAWFFFACFSAGTPAHSSYSSWLLSAGDDGSATRVLGALPAAGERAFVAALPQAALANPRGPLAVVGHVDLAWSWSYKAERLSPAGPRTVPRVERLSEAYRALLQGDRFGAAHHALSTFGMSVGASLLWLEEAAEKEEAPPRDPVFERAYLWLEYQDLTGYVLLGDPAARLPAISAGEPKAAPPEARAAERAPAKAAADPQVLRLENAVVECLSKRGDETRLPELAERLGLRPQELRGHVEAYRDAGRRALEERLSKK